MASPLVDVVRAALAAAAALAVAVAGGASSGTAATATAAAGSAKTTLSSPVRGKVTHYGPASTGGNCSYPGVPANKLTVAAGPDLYAKSAGCGGYVDVTAGRKTIRVKIDNLCPECKKGHLDLSDEAFAKLGPLGRGIIQTTYRVVTNPKPAPALSFVVKGGSSPYWLALLVDGTGNRVKSLEVKRGSRWQAMTRTDYGYWLASSGAGAGPFTVRVTDVAGHRATAKVKLTPGAVQRTSVHLYR